MKKLIKHVELTGIMVVQTGLRIGAGGSTLEIGGLDNPIIRDPLTRQPYVPGSSIKGKLRSLIEVSKYKIGSFEEPKAASGPCGCGRCVACWLFGCGKVENTKEPTRLIFRDCTMREESAKKLKRLLTEGLFYSEVKTEVTMDRASGKVGVAGPRSMDRIAAGTELNFQVTVRVFEDDDEKQMKKSIAHALMLLEKEGLGGSVTRGYGKVKFDNLKWDNEPFYLSAEATKS